MTQRPCVWEMDPKKVAILQFKLKENKLRAKEAIRGKLGQHYGRRLFITSLK